MNKKNRDDGFFLVCLLVFFIGLIVDLATKAAAEFLIPEHSLISFIPGFMNWTLEYNDGVAFGSLSDNPVLMNVITWLTLPLVIAMIVVVFFLPKQFNVHRFFIALVASGAIGNFLDRVFIAKGVRDFMDISSIHFGICNVADYFITIGGVLLILSILFVGDDAIFPLIGKSKKTEKQATEEQENNKNS